MKVKKLSLKRMLSLILTVCLMTSVVGVTSVTTVSAAGLNYVEEFDTTAIWSQFNTTYPGWSLSVDNSKISSMANNGNDPRVKTAGTFQFSTNQTADFEDVFITKTFDSNCSDNEIVFETKVSANSGNSPRRTALTINGAGGTLARLNFVENQKFSYNTDATNTTAITTSTKWHTDPIVIKIVISKSNPGENNPFDTCYYYIGDLNTPAAGGTNHMVNKTLTSVNGFSLVWQDTTGSIFEIYYDYFKMSSSKGSLAAPAKPVWDSNKTLTWSAVENADSYDIYLLRDGAAVDTYNTSDTSYGFSTVMTEKGNGSYTAQIVAKSTAGYKDSNKSSLSDAYVFADIPLEPLATPSAPIWSAAETVLNWSNVNSASGYEIKLYKDDVEGDILITTVSVEDALTYDFKDEMVKNGSGSYLAKIKALGDSLTCGDSEYSSSSALSVFDIEKYRKVNYVLDFEVPNFSLGDMAGQANVQHSSNTAPSNWTAKVVDEDTVKSVAPGGTSRALELKSDLGADVSPDGDVKIMFGGQMFSSSAVSISGRVYLSSYDDRVKLSLLKTAGSAVSQILFAQGRFAYRNSEGEKFFLNNNKLSAGWHDFEIRMFKDGTGNYTAAKYFFDGTESLPQDANDTIWVNSSTYVGGIWLQCLKTDGTHTIFDDITVSSFEGESRASASGVSDASWDGTTLKWTPQNNDNAVSYIARLYKNNELCSVVHVLPENVADGVDFADELVYDQDITYTATVQTKGDYSSYISSAESTPLKYDFDVDVSEFRVCDSLGNSLKENFYGDSLTLKVAISEGKAVNADMFLAYYNGNQLVSVGTKEINVTSDAQVRSESLTVPAPDGDVTLVKAFLFDKIVPLKPLLAPIILTPNEDLVMPVIFNDNMVLQRGEDVAIWGKAPAGRTVTVEFGGQTKTDVADVNGEWEVALSPMTANEVGQDLTVSTSKDVVTYSNVVVGDVYLVTGQSNAEWVMKNFSDTAEDIANANLPQIRYMKPTYTAANATASEELDEYSALIKKNWTPISPDMAADVGAVAFYFAKHLQPEAGVPIGIINNAKSGRNIREFLPTGCIPASVISNLPYECIPNGIVYNELFNPLKKLDITGVVWYQGENDYLYADYYTALFKAMADVLRADFENPELPIYYVQLHRYVNSEDSTKHFVEMRECMRQMPEHIDNIYMASIIDSPDVIGQIHPIGKSILGQRLASLALHHTYGREDVVPSGPIYESHSIDGTSIKVKFSSVGTGLEVRNADALSGFQIVDEDGTVYEATATITGTDEVTVTSEATKPVDVRYNHVPFPDPVTLYNSVGFCASSFATDVEYPINPVFTTLH